MQYLILERWPGDSAENLLFQFQTEPEAKRMFTSLKTDANKNRSPAQYRMVELEGEVQYEGKAAHDERKALGVKQILIQDGKIYNIMPDNTIRDSGEVLRKID